MSFKYLPKVAIADIAFEVSAKSPNSLFRDAALAATDIMVRPRSVKPKIRKQIEIVGESLENLLYDFLSELIYLKDSESLLFSRYNVKVKEIKVEGKPKFELTAGMAGELINRKRHELRNDLKAITMHMFSVRKNKKGFWKATVVVDI